MAFYNIEIKSTGFKKYYLWNIGLETSSEQLLLAYKSPMKMWIKPITCC